MSTLVNITQAAAELSLSWTTIDTYITSSGLQPEYVSKHGKRLVPLYDLEKLREGLKTQIEAHSKKAKTTPSVDIDIEPALNQLAERMAREYQGLFKSISADLADLVDNTALLKTQIGQLAEQNRLLMRAIQDVKCAAAPPLSSASGVAGASTPPTPAPSAPPIPPAPKPRITIVGLLASQQQMILNEYGEVFDLKMFHTDDAQGSSFRAAAENSAAVFTMVSFINHSVENVIKSMKGKVIRVTGGMTSLRDKLNDYFVNSTPKKETA